MVPSTEKWDERPADDGPCSSHYCQCNGNGDPRGQSCIPTCASSAAIAAVMVRSAECVEHVVEHVLLLLLLLLRR